MSSRCKSSTTSASCSSAPDSRRSDRRGFAVDPGMGRRSWARARTGTLHSLLRRFNPWLTLDTSCSRESPDFRFPRELKIIHYDQADTTPRHHPARPATDVVDVNGCLGVDVQVRTRHRVGRRRCLVHHLRAAVMTPQLPGRYLTVLRDDPVSQLCPGHLQGEHQHRHRLGRVHGHRQGQTRLADRGSCRQDDQLATV